MADPFRASAEPTRYPVEIRAVREVMVIGYADLAHWQARLRPEALWPRVVDGHAELAITAIAAHWLGLAFRELSISISISRRPEGDSHDGFFLMQAYNDRSAFAWVERTMFKTPYDPARIDLTTGPTCGIALHVDNRQVLRLERGVGVSVGTEVDVDWRGPIVLPGRTDAHPGRFFNARLAGHACQYAFVPKRDTLVIADEGAPAVWRELARSGFAADLWQVREAAVHGRTSSFDRDS